MYDKMSTQAFVGEEPKEELVQPITNRMFIKPDGGIWTSSYNEEFGSDWIRWMHSEQFYNNGHEDVYLLKPRDDAKIYTINSYTDLLHLIKQYPPIITVFGKFLDFEAIAKDYDGIHLTYDGEIATRYTDDIDLYGWDVECTLWFRWCFSSVEMLDKNIHDFADSYITDDYNDYYDDDYDYKESFKIDYYARIRPETFLDRQFFIAGGHMSFRCVDGVMEYAEVIIRHSDFFTFEGCMDYERKVRRNPYHAIPKEAIREYFDHFFTF